RVYHEADKQGAKPRSRVFAQQGDCIGLAAGWPVGTIRLKGAEAIRDGEYARANRNVLSAQPGRIAEAVPSLVMAQHKVTDRYAERHVLQNLGTDARVDLHPVELFR